MNKVKEDQPGCMLIGVAVLLPFLGFLAAFVLAVSGRGKSAMTLFWLSLFASIVWVVINS